MALLIHLQDGFGQILTDLSSPHLPPEPQQKPNKEEIEKALIKGNVQ